MVNNHRQRGERDCRGEGAKKIAEVLFTPGLEVLSILGHLTVVVRQINLNH